MSIHSVMLMKFQWLWANLRISTKFCIFDQKSKLRPSPAYHMSPAYLPFTYVECIPISFNFVIVWIRTHIALKDLLGCLCKSECLHRLHGNVTLTSKTSLQTLIGEGSGNASICDRRSSIKYCLAKYQVSSIVWRSNNIWLSHGIWRSS